MLKKESFLILLLFISATVQAQQKIKYKKTPDGLEYVIIKKGKGEKLKKEDRIYINYTTRIKPDTVFDSSKEKPFAFILGQEEVLPGWDEGVSLLSVGDSALFRIPPTLAYGSKKLGNIPANTTLLLELKVIKTEKAFYNLTGKDTVTFQSGLKKISVKQGVGESPKPSENVTLQFTGFVKNEKGYKKIFQSSLTNSSLAIFQIGTGRMVKGLDQGIATMKIGEKATFIVPPDLGFGKEIKGDIPANSTLYFDIELLSSTDPFFHTTNTDTITTTSGLKILPLIQTENKPITIENVVSFDYTGYFIEESGNRVIFDNTIERKKMAILRPGAPSGFPYLGEALTHLKKGEKAILYVPAELAFGKAGKGIVPPNTPLIYDIEVQDVITYPFFETKGLDTVKLASGLQYIQIRKTEDVIADSGNAVSVAYTGYIIDTLGHRKIFDASRESRKTMDFILGMGKVISGFDEGIKGMRKEEGRRLIIPYTLGYGENGIPTSGIPGKTTIYFDVELVEIKNK